MENIVIIATFSEPKDAYYLKLKLEDEVIETYLTGNILEKTRNKVSPTMPLKVEVNSYDVEKTIQVLIKVHDELKSLPYE